MADLSFKVTGNDVEKVLEATNDAIYRALDMIGVMAADYAAALAPVDTGNLRNSLTSEVDEDEKAVYVGTNVEYAPHVEYGTVKMKAQPYLKPAMEEHLDEFKGIFEQELSTINS